ncbi:hypothetical protein TrCOL_g7883 [Triparma columacea]|uniref:PRORP domain-containing protein n=1 Tax=Triparma columacea TaxID=722753 RepID=A0A9W7GBW1_9STRA|nr:hypothetical protein TrCOL_g7883 [Triparma columacea]
MLDMVLKEGRVMGKVGNEAIVQLMRTSVEGCEVKVIERVRGDGALEEGVRLRSIEPGVEECCEMVKMNEEIVTNGRAEGDETEFQGGGKGRKRELKVREKGRRAKEWGRFKEWLEGIGEYTHVLDGANIGYLGGGMGIKWAQIGWVMRAIREGGGRGVVVMHQRHFDNLQGEDWSLVRSWGGDVYRTPNGMNDDWFWLHMSLCQGCRRGGRMPWFVSNDELRDHVFGMRASRSLEQWRERKGVKFKFGDWEREARWRRPVLNYPRGWSKRVMEVSGGWAIPWGEEGEEGKWTYVKGSRVDAERVERMRGEIEEEKKDAAKGREIIAERDKEIEKKEKKIKGLEEMYKKMKEENKRMEEEIKKGKEVSEESRKDMSKETGVAKEDEGGGKRRKVG